MIDVRKERDPERLRQVAVLLEQENTKLHERLANLAAQVDELKGQDPQTLQREIEALKAEFAGFASSAEDSSGNKSERRGRKRRDRKDDKKEREEYGTTDQPELDVEQQVLTLSEDDRRCSKCGGLHAEMTGQFEESEYIDVVQRSFKLVRQKRQKYARGCDCEPDEPKVYAAASPTDRDTVGGRYSIRFLCMVAALKYAEHMPLNRQAKQYGFEKLNIGTNSMFSGLWSLADYTAATCQAIHDDILSSTCVHIDETGWPGLDAPDETRELWSVVSPRGAYYRVLPNRSSEGAAVMLKDFKGWLMADGLAVYEKTARELGHRLTNCWSHVRRKFIDCEGDFAEATVILDMIDEMFLIEREITDILDEGEVKSHKFRRKARKWMRRKRTKPIFEKLFAYAALVPVLTSTKLGTAIRYMINRRHRLRVFLDHADVPMTNNDAERALRAGVIGRKNFNGTRSRRGEIIAGIYYTLCSTAKMWGIPPPEYIEAVVRHERVHPDSPLLPADYLQQQSG